MLSARYVFLFLYFFIAFSFFKTKPFLKNQNSIHYTKISKKEEVYDPQFLRKKNIKISCTSHKEMLCAEIGSTNSTEGHAYKEINRLRQHIETTKVETKVKIFCAIYTHSGNSQFTDAQSETWAKKCDGLLFSSDVTNSTTGHFQLPTKSRHGYKYKGMIQRLRSMYAFIYDNFLNEYDFFHFCGDDTYVIVENLKRFVASETVKEWEREGNYFAGGFWAHW